MKDWKSLSAVLLIVLMLTSCKDTLPKPSAYLRLTYPQPTYKKYENCFYDLNVNNKATVIENKCDIKIAYPKMKATIYLSYKPVQSNLKSLLQDAQKLTYEHVVKADEIIEQPYEDKSSDVYGMLYRLGGNSASNTQFYLTDNTKHFVVGSVYFYSKPNFDSIMPATKYLEREVTQIMETLHWKDN